MKKIVFLEGLPGIGKTTIVNSIRKRNLDNVHVVDEVIVDVEDKTPVNQESYFRNDEMKLAQYNDGVIFIDRGPISTLSYNVARSIIDPSFDSTKAKVWFNQFIKILKDESNGAIYFTTKEREYYIPFNNALDPYGSKENQKLLETITLENCKKYVSNLKIKEYYKKDMEEIINEILIEYLCT